MKSEKGEMKKESKILSEGQSMAKSDSVNEAYKSWILVLESWFLDLGSWILVLGSWFLVLGSWFLVLTSYV